jgi:hypothetical protein
MVVIAYGFDQVQVRKGRMSEEMVLVYRGGTVTTGRMGEQAGFRFEAPDIIEFTDHRLVPRQLLRIGILGRQCAA